MDYVPSWWTPGGMHPSTFDPWANYTYQSWNAETHRSVMKCRTTRVRPTSTDGLPDLRDRASKGNDNIGFYAQDMPADAITRIILERRRTSSTL